GLPGRHAFLVAQDFRTYVSGIAGPAGGLDRVPGLQPDVLPPVHPGLPRDAAALLAVSAGVPGSERAFDRRVYHSRRWISFADGVFPVVDALRKNCAGQ